MPDTDVLSENRSPFYVLSLDGGGSKGVYTLGVLRELEQYWGVPLHTRFRLIFGTSTGAIIASLLALGEDVATIEKQYFDLIPRVMQHKSASKRTEALRTCAREVFSDKRFDAFKTRIGIVATNYDRERPMIFKSHRSLAYGLQSSFDPGFGLTIADAVIASAAAFPFFEMAVAPTSNQGNPTVVDGGFSANNPTLLAIADAHRALQVDLALLRVLSVGVGHYKEPKRSWYHERLFNFWPFRMIQKTLAINSNTIEALRSVLFPDVVCVRIDDAFADTDLATDLLEADREQLRRLFVLGRESYAKHERAIVDNFPAEHG